MANARTQDFIDSLQNLLGDELDDPNHNRDNPSTAPFGWIYNTPINFQMPQYPRIHIDTVSNSPERFEIGSTRRQDNERIQVAILVGTGSGNELDIDGDGEDERPPEIRDFLKTKVSDLIDQNQDRWRALGDNSLDMLVVNDQKVETSKSSVEAHVVEAIVKNIR